VPSRRSVNIARSRRASAGILARAVADARDLEEANEILSRRGVPTELERERAAASPAG
jgi:hypothetical protein